MTVERKFGTCVAMLSETRKRELKARYETWGPDKVRAELVRAGRAVYADPEVSRYAAEWLDEKERGYHRRREIYAKALMIVAVFEVTLVLAF